MTNLTDLTKTGKQRYDSFKPLWYKRAITLKLFSKIDELYDEVRRVLKEQMCEQGKVCTLFNVITRSYELAEFFELGTESIVAVEAYSYEQLLARFEGMIQRDELTAVGVRFEPYFEANINTIFIMICNE